MPFDAIYKPNKFDERGMCEGLDDEKAEAVLILKVFANRQVVFIHKNGTLDRDDMHCFSECRWR
jgi:hypothetical protein